jgi:hypothetical protein
MESPFITEADVQEGRESTLGPAYFASRRVVEAALADLPDNVFEPIVKMFVDAAYERLQEAVEKSIWFDAEMNLQAKLYGGIDEVIASIIAGKDWAITRYGIDEARYGKGPAMREAIAKHLPQEMLDGRIADLEAEVKRLKEQLEWRCGQ